MSSSTNGRRTITSLTGLSATLLGILAGCSAAPTDGPSTSTSNALGLGPGQPITTALPGWNAAWDDTTANDVGAATPAATSWGPGRLDLFTHVGTQLLQKTWTGSGWSPSGAGGLVPTKDTMSSDPAGMGWGGGYIDLVWRDPASSLEHLYWTGSAWAEENLGGTFAGRPSIVVASDGSRGDAFVRVGTGVWHREWTVIRNDWRGWEPLSFTVTGDPVAVSDVPGRIEVFYRATDGETLWTKWDGTATGTTLATSLSDVAWTSAASLGGYIEATPAVTATGGLIMVAAVGGAATLYSNFSSNAGQSWNGWTQLPGCSRLTQVALAAQSGARQDVFAVSNDTADVLHTFESTSYSSAPGLTPVCCANDAKQLDAVSGPTSITVTFSNQDDTDVTVTATNQANASDTHSAIVSGQGNLTYTFTGLSPSSTYTLVARTGGGESGCSATSEGEIATESATQVFDVDGTEEMNDGAISFNATVTVMDTGEVTWTAQMNHSGSYDYSYDLQITFPGISGALLDLKGEIGSASITGSTTTNPPTVPLTSAGAMALVKAGYSSLYGKQLGWTMSSTVHSVSGVTGAASFCSNGGAVQSIDVCCNCGAESNDQVTEQACDDEQAVGEASGPDGQHPGCLCTAGQCLAPTVAKKL